MGLVIVRENQSDKPKTYSEWKMKTELASPTRFQLAGIAPAATDV